MASTSISKISSSKWEFGMKETIIFESTELSINNLPSPSCHLLNNKSPSRKRPKFHVRVLSPVFSPKLTRKISKMSCLPACSVTVLLKGHHSQQSFSGDVTSPGKFRIVKHVLCWISACWRVPKSLG